MEIEKIFIQLDCDGNLFIWENPGTQELIQSLGEEEIKNEPRPIENLPFLNLCG